MKRSDIDRLKELIRRVDCFEAVGFEEAYNLLDSYLASPYDYGYEIRILPCSTDEDETRHGVRLYIGPQSFQIGSDSWDTKAEAQWYADQLDVALKRIVDSWADAARYRAWRDSMLFNPIKVVQALKSVTTREECDAALDSILEK